MKPKGRKASQKKPKLQRKNRKAVRGIKRARRYQLPVRRKKPVLQRKRNQPIDPRVARALGLMRREGVSASHAARRERMKLNTFRKGAGRFLYRSGPVKPWKARTEDQLAFSMEVLTPQGRLSVIVRSSRERRLLQEYENALRMFRGAEDEAEAELKMFEGKSVGGHLLITDPKRIIELEEADVVDFDNLYTSPGGRS
jgi:hypothetical protein